MKNFDNAINKLTRDVLISTIALPSIIGGILIVLTILVEPLFLVTIPFIGGGLGFMLWVDIKFYRDIKITNDRIITLYKEDPKECARLMSNTLGIVDREYREVITFLQPRRYLSLTTYIFAPKQEDLYTKIIKYIER